MKTEQTKQNILNELLNANIKRMLDKSPTVEPNANYNKSHIYSIDLTEILPCTQRVKMDQIRACEIDQIQRPVLLSN